ncbi:MAG: cytochrome c oxidase subunit 3 family protein, partial [Deltaproteobacteria bacterium]|nr:cytochrome c oxidase subunit 3 family protein [Deltaproteobacteria bacterium]
MQHVVPHHFESAEQAFESSKLGLWLFLVTEILLFGGLFVTYIIYRALYPEMFHEASHHLNKVLGAVNTVVLIWSSFSMALAVVRTRQIDSAKANEYILIPIFFAARFMV